MRAAFREPLTHTRLGSSSGHTMRWMNPFAVPFTHTLRLGSFPNRPYKRLGLEYVSAAGVLVTGPGTFKAKALLSELGGSRRGRVLSSTVLRFRETA